MEVCPEERHNSLLTICWDRSKRKSMKKQRNRRISLLLTVGLCISLFAGCGGKMTPKKMMHQVEENLAIVTSFSNHVELDIKMEEIVHYTKVTMDMELENTMKPKAGHAKGTAEVTMRGVNLTSELEIYQVEEDGSQVTYSGMDSQWVKEVAEQNTDGIALDKNLFSEMSDSIDTFQLAEEAVDVDGVPCYEMYGNVSGRELMGVLGTQMIHGFGLVELPDDSAVAGLQIPLIFDVYQDKMLPARMLVDMTEVMNELYDSLGEPVEVTHYVIELSFADYDSVDEIYVPQNIRQMAELTA